MARKTLSKKYWLRIVEFEELQERQSIRSSRFDGMVCPIAGVMAAVGDRWDLLITHDLVLGLKRYHDFRRSSGVTNATISHRLKYLEDHQLIERRFYQEHPPRYEYFLAKKGRDIGPVLMVLAELGDRWRVSAASEPPLIFVNRETGSAARWGILDHDTGQRLSGADISLKEGPGADDTMRGGSSTQMRTVIKMSRFLHLAMLGDQSGKHQLPMPFVSTQPIIEFSRPILNVE